MRKTQSAVFFPNLDALRFFCFIAVFFFHSFATKFDYILSDKAYLLIKHRLFGNGNLGVNFFFVLSGFLITYLLLTEKKDQGYINVKNFYIRRILRIWPLFYFCVFFGFIIFPYLKQLFGQVSIETATPGYYFFFLNNFDFINKGLPDSSVLGILWSVAIEEQFYLVWPIIIYFINKRWLPFIFSGVLISSFIGRLLNANNTLFLEHHTLSCISDMTIGGMGAFFVFFSTEFKNWITNLSKSFLWILYFATFILFLFRKEIFNHFYFTIALDRLAVSIIFILIILEQNFCKNSLFKLQSLKVISKLGQYTYGLYCLHMIGILVIATLLLKFHLSTTILQVILLEGGLSLLLTIGIAYISYHYFEKRFLKLKIKFEIVKTQKQTDVEDE